MNALRRVYGRMLRLARWARSFWLTRQVRHGALTIVPDRLIGPELALWQDQLIDTIQGLPVASMPDCDVVVHEASHRPAAGRRVRRIRFQPEHLLVKPGGADSEQAPLTALPVAGTDQTYLFRLLHQASLAHADLILDYSDCNMAHWHAGAQRQDLFARARVLAPLVLPVCHERRSRQRELVTLFSNPNAGRRAAFLSEARARGLAVRNAGSAYRRDRLLALLDDTHVLINMRQSEHHDTFESLRVLPALARGVLVVSEDVPLREHIPYQDCVVWANRSELVDVVEAVHANRERYWQEIFGSGRCAERLQALWEQNRRMLADFLASP